ncbi:hypothetical protein F5882DRAFT_311384, partial [Hyaloscypha sp. PMI_1271]
ITVADLVLEQSRDWEEWLEIIKTAALKADVWDYINPQTPRDLLPTLQEPVRPTPSTVKPSTARHPTLFTALDDDEREHLRTLQADYIYDRAKYDKRKEGLVDMQIQIQATIDREYLSYTFNCTPYEMPVRLQERFAPTDEIKEEELIKEWKTLCKQWPTGRNLHHPHPPCTLNVYALYISKFGFVHVARTNSGSRQNPNFGHKLN